MGRIHPLNDIKSYFKSNKLSVKIVLLIIIILSLGTYLGVTLGRYVYLEIKHSIFSSNSFYFNCDKLAEDTSVYQLNNWSGAESYSIIFNMNSLKNNLVGSTSDIDYNITVNCSANVVCQASKTSGVITTTSHADSFSVMVTPNVTFNDGDRAVINVSASSTSPYVKTLSGKFTFVVGRAGLTYEIEDVANRPYLALRITNTLDYYLVRTAFGSYSVNDRIDITTYQALSAADKANCASTIIALSFNPANVVLDMTSKAYLKGYNFTNQTVNNVSYINAFSFKMDALSSELVYFYKNNVASDYTYPITNSTSIITVNYS